WMIDPIPDVASHAFAKHFVDRSFQQIATVRLQRSQPLRQCRNPLRRIEIEDHERFGRPIIEYAIGPKRPAPHMSQAFSLTQIKFASLDIREWPLGPLKSSAQNVAFHTFLLRRLEIVDARTARGQY